MRPMADFDFSSYFWQGRKVRLRAFKPSDWTQKYQEFIDSDTRRILECGLDLPETPEAYQGYFTGDNDIKEDNKLSMAIETLEGEFVGWINVFLGSAKNGVFSCGMGIFSQYRRMGYAEEALRIALRYCFQELRYQKCNAECLIYNQASIKLQQRLGFVQEGIRRRVYFTGGEFHDEYLSGLTREEFEANDAKYLES